MNLLKKSLFILFIAPLFTNAQNYKPGFVVNLKGDTIKGYIDFKQWSENPKSINFKKAVDSSYYKMTANDINYFEIPSFIAYKTYSTSISLGETDLKKIADYNDTSSKVDLVFLKVLEQGTNVTLYSYSDNIKDRYYIFDSKNKKLTELIYRIYLAENENKLRIAKTQYAYKQQLLLIAQQYPTYSESIYNLLQDAVYYNTDLIAVCKKINNSAEVSKNSRNYKGEFFKFFIGGGVAQSSINLTGNFPLFDAKQRSTSCTSPYFSAGVNIYPFPDVAKTVVKLEMSYFNTKNTVDGHIYYTEPFYYTSYSFVQNIISISPIFELSVYNTDAFKAYLGAGFNLDFAWYSGNSVFNSYTGEDQKDYVGLNPSWFTIPIKAGFVISKHYDFSVLYILPGSISNTAAGLHQNNNYSFNLQTLKIGISYIFR